MKVGEVEFEVECDEEQLQSAVGKILSTVTEKLREAPFLAEKSAGIQRAETCKGIIQELWNGGFFEAGRELGEVHSEMARKGFHYDRTAVAHALIDLVKEGILTREGKPRRYVYAQKRPPPSGKEGIQKQVSDTGVGKTQDTEER
jgi:predicted transcriptional regulator